MLWTINGAYYRATMGRTMEQQWGVPWSSNGAYHGAYHEQEKGIQWSSNGAYYSACHRFIYEGVAGLLQGYILIHNGAVYTLSLLYGMPYCCSIVCPIATLLLLYGMPHCCSRVCPIIAHSIACAVYGPITYTIIALLHPYLWSYYESTTHRSTYL